MYIYNLPTSLTVRFAIMCSMRYQPIFHTLCFTLNCARILNNTVLTTIIEMVDKRVGKCSVERVRYVITIYYT